MCGIFGCVLHEPSSLGKVIREALERLEYRGYDSAGIATVANGTLHFKKDAGRISEIHMREGLDLPGTVGIGHTRWATHGAPSKENAHPHIDCTASVAVVHNGVIDNYIDLRRELENRDHNFTSKTDTEVLPHLIEETLKTFPLEEEAVRQALLRVDGSYAVAVIFNSDNGKLVVARKNNPLIIGVSERGYYAASDIPALLPLTNSMIEMKNNEFAVLTAKGVKIATVMDNVSVERQPRLIEMSMEAAQKQGFPHYMLKEIWEQPQSLRNALHLQERYLDLLATFLDRANDIFFLASGTSYHACVAASYMFNKLACLPTYPVIASEFIQRYGDAANVGSTVFAVSQSGETADVLQALEHARMRATTILGLTNVIGSTLTRVSRAYISQQSGPEIGVAATKTFTAQLAVLAQLGLRVAKLRGKISQDDIDEMQTKLSQIPVIVEKVLPTIDGKVAEIARKYAHVDCFFFLGRGISYATASEGALKLLEIARVPCLAYPSGESKHGPISLIDKGFPVVLVVPNDSTRKTMLGSISEMKSRGASIITVGEEDDSEVQGISDESILMPKGIPELLTPIPYVVPLQLLAYHMALERKCDPDRPINLAKSVTVL